MTATHTQIDWNGVRERLARYEVQSADCETVDRDRLVEVFRQRARELERRGRHETTKVARIAVVAFRLGNERFGVPLADLQQVFPRVPITSIPGKRDLLIGVANLDGILRSVIDLNLLLRSSTTHVEDGYLVLLRAGECSLAVSVEALDGVSEIDLDNLVAVDELISSKAGKLLKGITDNRIIILDTAAVISHVKEQLSGCEP
jgi:chemotaxis signal transduction protein